MNKVSGIRAYFEGNSNKGYDGKPGIPYTYGLLGLLKTDSAVFLITDDDGKILYDSEPYIDFEWELLA